MCYFAVLCSANPGPNPGASPGQNGAITPEITRQPMDKIVKRQGTATFECQAEGLPVPNISWLKDGRPLITGREYFSQTPGLRNVLTQRATYVRLGISCSISLGSPLRSTKESHTYRQFRWPSC